jgi:hypothetical protein
MAGRFYNRRFASRSSRDGCAGAWMSSLRRVLSVLARKYPWRGGGMRPRSKKPGAVSRPGGWRNFGEYAFLEDSRYTSQQGRRKIFIVRLLQCAKA